MDPEDLQKVIVLRRAFEEKSSQEIVEMLVKSISKTKNNQEFLSLINVNYKPPTSNKDKDNKDKENNPSEN